MSDLKCIRLAELPEEYKFEMKALPGPFEVVCLRCNRVFEGRLFGMYLQENGGKESLWVVVAPTEAKPFVCSDCRETQEKGG